jgi:predicted tellurium resistance membrane protein TerC
MSELLSLENLGTLVMLIFLQAVLGFDNLLYISIESKRVPLERQQSVRRWGIGLAAAFRIILLFVVIEAIAAFQTPLGTLSLGSWAHGEFTVHALIVLAGGIFILYTAVKEIAHMLAIQNLGEDEEQTPSSVKSVVAKIVAMNLVFSFDSILSAIALTDEIVVMAIAILVSSAMMIFLAEHVAEFLKKNRLYEVLGLFILFVVGIMLVSEGGHLAHLVLGGSAVTPMAKSTFYFVIIILVAVDLAQGRYQKKLMHEKNQNGATEAGEERPPHP